MEIHFFNNKFNSQIDNTEYKYENEKYLILYDVNYDKNTKFISLIDTFNNDLTYSLFEENINGGYFIVVIDKILSNVSVFRDVAGIKSGFFAKKDNQLFIGNNVHRIAKLVGATDFNEIAVDMLLTMEFIQDGLTIYKNIYEFTMGSYTKLDFEGKEVEALKKQLYLEEGDNSLSYNENTKNLRDEIVKAHQRLTSTDNVVYLSGGIDSCVMLAALDDILPKGNIHSISYKVKGTNQDETPYATSIARYLGITNEIIEVDPFNSRLCDDFEEHLLKLNNPYIGYWIFTPKDNSLNRTYFAGQDTRLHTPAVNQLDKLVFSFYSCQFSRILSKSVLKHINSCYTGFYNKYSLFNYDSNIIKNSDRFFSFLDFENYINRYFFKLYPQKTGRTFSKLDTFDEIKQFYNLDFSKITSSRNLYNEIVRIKWAEQYTDDIRYMQDMAKSRGTYIQMPFYDPKLAKYSSSIPFDYATKFIKGKAGYSNDKVLINKVLLRDAFKDKLNEEVFARKKAVSVTNHLLFRGTLGKYVKKAIEDDLALSTDKSFIKRYGYDKAFGFNLYKDIFEQSDYALIIKIYYLSTLCIYNKMLLV